jgi:hypothetical protein
MPNGETKQSREHTFDDDTDEALVLPKPVPEVTNDDDDDKKRADSAFDDLEIDVDEEEVKAESQNEPPGRKF